MLLLGNPEGTLDILHTAERLAQELNDQRGLAQVYGDLGNYYTFKGNPELGIEYSEKSFDQMEKIGDISSMSLIATQVCAANLLAGNFLKVVDIVRRVLPLLEEQHVEKSLSAGRITKYSLLCGQCGGLAMGALGMFEEGKHVLTKGLNISYQADARWAMGWVEHLYSVLFYYEGDANETIAHAEKAIRFFEETGNNFFAGNAWSVLGVGYYLRGNYTTAIQHIEKGIRIQKEEGVPTMLPYSYAFLASGYSAIGDLEHARRSAEEGLKVSQDVKTKAFEGCLWIQLGSIMGKAESSQVDEAQRIIQKGISILEERKARALYAQGYLVLGELFADAGRREEALENLKKAESLYQEMGVTPKSHWLKRTQEGLAKLEATH
jgi:tetratricopeptide (TPR) repeat protein